MGEIVENPNSVLKKPWSKWPWLLTLAILLTLSLLPQTGWIIRLNARQILHSYSLEALDVSESMMIIPIKGEPFLDESKWNPQHPGTVIQSLRQADAAEIREGMARLPEELRYKAALLLLSSKVEESTNPAHLLAMKELAEEAMRQDPRNAFFVDRALAAAVGLKEWQEADRLLQASQATERYETGSHEVALLRYEAMVERHGHLGERYKAEFMEDLGPLRPSVSVRDHLAATKLDRGQAQKFYLEFASKIYRTAEDQDGVGYGFLRLKAGLTANSPARQRPDYEEAARLAGVDLPLKPEALRRDFSTILRLSDYPIFTTELSYVALVVFLIFTLAIVGSGQIPDHWDRQSPWWALAFLYPLLGFAGQGPTLAIALTALTIGAIMLGRRDPTLLERSFPVIRTVWLALILFWVMSEPDALADGKWASLVGAIGFLFFVNLVRVTGSKIPAVVALILFLISSISAATGVEAGNVWALVLWPASAVPVMATLGWRGFYGGKPVFVMATLLALTMPWVLDQEREVRKYVDWQIKSGDSTRQVLSEGADDSV